MKNIARLELYFNMYKPIERCYMTSYYYDTKRVTWLSKVQFSRESITDDWKMEGKS